MTVTIVPNTGKSSAGEVALRAAQILRSHGAAVLMDQALQPAFNIAGVQYLPFDDCLHKTDVILTPGEIGGFFRSYLAAVAGRFDTATLRERLPLFFTVTCLRGVTWCAMALREYARPGRPLTNGDTLVKLRQYLSEDFLQHILERYVRRDFLGGAGL